MGIFNIFKKNKEKENNKLTNTEQHEKKTNSPETIEIENDEHMNLGQDIEQLYKSKLDLERDEIDKMLAEDAAFYERTRKKFEELDTIKKRQIEIFDKRDNFDKELDSEYNTHDETLKEKESMWRKYNEAKKILNSLPKESKEYDIKAYEVAKLRAECFSSMTQDDEYYETEKPKRR